MVAETSVASHRYGAVLSVVAVGVAIVAIAVGGPLEPLIFPLGFFGPLCGFYFVGGVLGAYPRYHVLGEELMRGVVWYGGSLLGWAFILTESTVLPATPITALGLPAVTALGFGLAMVGLRRATGYDLKVQTEGGQPLVAFTGAIVGGFIVLYAIPVEGQSSLIALVYVLATAGGLGVWWRHWQRGRANP